MPLPRRTFLLGALAVAACGAPATAPSTGRFPRTVVDHAGDAVRIEAPPRRVVVATEYSAFDALLALGVPPVAATRRFATDWPWAAAAGAAAVPRIEEPPDGPDVEALAGWAPDLLFLQGGLDPSIAATLRRLAPTVQYNADDGRASLRTVADALGIPERAEPLVADLNARVGAARDRIRAAGRGGWTFTTFEPHSADSAGFWGLGTDATLLLTDLGLRPSPLLAGTTGYGTLSPELIEQLDADLIIGRDIVVGNDEAFTGFEANPLFQALPGVAGGRYRRLDVQDSYAIGQSSILSWAAAVDLLADIVLEVPG